MLIRTAAEQAAKAWERRKGRMADRKRGEGKRRPERGKGQAGRDQQGSKAQQWPPCFLAAAVCDLMDRGVGMKQQGEWGTQDTGVFVYLIRKGKKAASGPDSQGHVTSWPARGHKEVGEHPGRWEKQAKEEDVRGLWGAPL